MQKNDCKNRRAQVFELQKRLKDLKEKQAQLELKQLAGDRSDKTRRQLDSVTLSIEFTENRIKGIDTSNDPAEWMPSFNINPQKISRL